MNQKTKQQIKEKIERSQEIYKKLEESIREQNFKDDDLTGKFAYSFGFTDSLYRSLVKDIEEILK